MPTFELLKGSRVRVQLVASDLKARQIVMNDDVRDLLWPGFFAIQKLKDREPIKVTLPGGVRTTLTLDFYGNGVSVIPAF